MENIIIYRIGFVHLRKQVDKLGDVHKKSSISLAVVAEHFVCFNRKIMSFLEGNNYQHTTRRRNLGI